MSKEKKLSLFFKLEAFFKCPFTFNSEAQKADSRPVWVEGLVGCWTSQRVVRADLPGGAGSTWTWQPVFRRLREPEAGGATVQNQLVCGSTKRCAHLCSPVLGVILSRAHSLAPAEVGAAVEEVSWVFSCF